MILASISGCGRFREASAGMLGGRVDFSISLVTGNRTGLSQNGPEDIGSSEPSRERDGLNGRRVQPNDFPLLSKITV